eukprot:6653662-Lingulodinium_polyedra.AAC.1
MKCQPGVTPSSLPTRQCRITTGTTEPTQHTTSASNQNQHKTEPKPMNAVHVTQNAGRSVLALQLRLAGRAGQRG